MILTLGIPLLACIIAVMSCSKKDRKPEITERKPLSTPKSPRTSTRGTTPVTTPATTTPAITPAKTPGTTVKTPNSNVKTPNSMIKPHQNQIKPEPTQPSLIQTRPIEAGPSKMMENFLLDSFEDHVEDDTLYDAQSLKGVNLDIRSDSFPLAKKEKLRKQGRGQTAVPCLGPRRSLDRFSVMKEDVTAEDTDISVRETKKIEILGRTKSIDRVKTKTKDETVGSDKKKAKSNIKQKTLATDREHQREKKRNTMLERRKKSRENKSKEKQEDKEKSKAMNLMTARKSFDKLVSKSIAPKDKNFIPSAECYKVKAQ